jgi:hypothetical protein
MRVTAWVDSNPISLRIERMVFLVGEGRLSAGSPPCARAFVPLVACLP